MKKPLYILILLGITSCRQDRHSLENYDMSRYCKKYYVLVEPKNPTLYIFISKRHVDDRFIIWKDYDYKNSGYGFLYNLSLDLDGAVENGVYSNANEAIKHANDELKNTETRNFWLQNIVLLDKGEWSAYGEILREICD